MIKNLFFIRLLIYLFIFTAPLTFQECALKKNDTVKVHKPKKRRKPYDHQKDRGKKNLKTVKMKN